jgi:hypothetical protein
LVPAIRGQSKTHPLSLSPPSAEWEELPKNIAKTPQKGPPQPYFPTLTALAFIKAVKHDIVRLPLFNTSEEFDHARNIKILAVIV